MRDKVGLQDKRTVPVSSENTDKYGYKYYTITDQSPIDAFLSSIIPFGKENWQAYLHGVWYGGKLVDGTSVIKNERTLFDDVSTSAEFEQAKQAIATLPVIGAPIVTAYEIGSIIYDLGKKLFVEVPTAMSVAKRDDILLEIMKDANINSIRNYNENFINAAYEADMFIQQEGVSWMFENKQFLGGLTSYQFGREVYYRNTWKESYKVALDGLYNQFYSMLWQEVLESFGSPKYDGRGELSYVLPVGVDIPELQEITKGRARELTELWVNQLGENAKIIAQYFQKLFCPHPSKE